MTDTDRFFIVTGGPGSGKSTLIAALSEPSGRTGHCSPFHAMPEAGRAIIQDQVAIGGGALPWADRLAFAELMLNWELRSHRMAGALSGPVIFDRGLPDVLGYLRLSGLAVPAHVERAANLFRYNPRVFLAPPWPAIYVRDAERRQTPAEAEATCGAVSEAYAALGYELMPLPLAPVAERVAFVRRIIGV